MADFAAMAGALAFATGKPAFRAALRAEPADFVVDEELGFAPDGAGEHLFVRVRKTGLSTAEVARRLARAAGRRPADVGFAGMKDRRAECAQWFSVTGGADDLADRLAGEPFEVLETRRNSRKLRRGVHRANRFAVTLRRCAGGRAEVEEKLDRLARRGMPNYFGEQRFGRGFGNLEQARAMLSEAPGGRRPGPLRRGMLLSAARAFLFNRILSDRLRDGTWSAAVPGDVMSLDGSGRCFAADPERDGALAERLERLDIHVTGLLPGRQRADGRRAARDRAAAIERAACGPFQDLVEGLRRCGVKAGRRPLRCRVTALEWRWLGGGRLGLRFSLPAGAYATSLLRELCLPEPP